MQVHHVFAASILSAAVLSVPLHGEDLKDDARDTGNQIQADMNRAGDEAQQAADRAGDRIDRAGDAARDDMKDADKAKSDTAKMEKSAKPLALPAGFTADEAGEDPSPDLRKTLSTAIEAALTRDGFDDMVERFVDQDRNRIGESDLNYDAFNAAVQTFRENWRAKYGNDFELDEEQMFTDAKAVTGQVSDPQVAMLHWPVNARGEAAAMDMARPAAGMDQTDDANELRADANLGEGRNVAVARIGGEKGKDLTLSFIGEAGGWKLDLPNNVTGTQLLSDVTQCITKANGMQDQWPDDEAKAKAHVSHKLLAAIYGVDKADKADKAGADAQKANITIKGDQ